jgi:ATP-dependent helicase/nuclease subunit B
LSPSLYNLDPLIPLVEAGYVILTPNFRLARRIKAEWDVRQGALGKQVWEPLPVHALEHWLEQQWQHAVSLGLLPPLVPLSQPQLLELWQQEIAREEAESGQYHLLRPAGAAELASQARENLLRWQVDLSQPAIRQQFALDTDCGTFLRWQALFEQRLATAGLATPGDLIRALLTCAAQLPPGRAVLVEFDDIPPLMHSALDVLCEDVRDLKPPAEPGQCLAHGFADKRAELQAVARWAAETSRQEPEATLGIVLGDMAQDRTALEYLLRREFCCLGENYTSLPVNFSTGIALDQAPVARDALAALAMALPTTTVAAVVGLLQSRFLHLPDADTALANRFVTRLYDAGRESLAIADLRYWASQLQLGDSQGLTLGAHLLAVSGLRDLRRPAPPSRWVERFCQVLAIWGWPGSGPLDSLEYQQVELWYRTLDEFRAYDAVCGPLDFDAALQLLVKTCAQKVSQPRTADSMVQVLGPLEAAGLGFDQLWLCGMQGSSWPAPARPNPFIPTALQRHLQMPHATAEREWAFAETLLSQYRRSTAVLHASYCRQLDDIPDLPSALLGDFSEVAVPGLPVLPADWVTRWQARAVESVADNTAPPVDAVELADMGGGSGLLEDQSQCPFRAFARRRMLVEPLAGFSLALSAADRGSLLHDALYALWGQISDHMTLQALSGDGESQAVQQAVQAALESVPGGLRRSLPEAYWQLEARRLAALLHEWLAVERQRGEFFVAQREQDITVELGRLRLRLRVDRIDQLPDGSRVIIDYKSGASKVQDWLGDRPARPQLLLYGIAEPDSAAALAFAQIRPRDSRFVGLGRTAVAPGIQTDIPKVVSGSMAANDWQSLNECWRSNLERLAQEFVRGDAGVDPLGPASCAWCGLQPLCRVAIGEGESL